MTKNERKALENYTNHLWEMKQYYKEQANRMETAENKEWYTDRVREYFDSWVAAHTMMVILEDKKVMKYWLDED